MAGEPVTPRRLWTAVVISLAIAIACALSLPLVGSAKVEYGRALAGVYPDHAILFQVRVPRVLLAMLAGGALALAGVIFQGLLRNGLADAYTLGVSSGASLGAVIAISSGWRDLFGMHALWVCAFLGASTTLLGVMGVASDGGKVSPYTLLMAGITINSICLAGILFLHSMAGLTQSIAITRWLMGGIEPVNISSLAWLSVFVFPVVIYVWRRARDWNLLSVGEEWAAIRGVSTQRLMLSGYVVGSVLTGAVTALTGPIGFLGLIVPHALRLMIGADHRVLTPCSFLAGASFLALCDTGSRTLMAPAEIPVGVITSLLGGPFFIWLLRSRLRKG
jgi:iron complex transport system permease protein